MRVLLAVDQDDRYRDVVGALDWCLALGAADEVIVAHAVATLRWMPLRSGGEPGWAGVEQAILERVDVFLGETVEEVESRGVSATALRLEGDVAEELLRATEERAADVIVLGAIGQSRSQDFLVGSVAEKVQSLSSRDVLFVRPRGAEARSEFRVLVAVDGSEASLEAIDAFAAKLRAERAELRLLHVLEIAPSTWAVELAQKEARSSSVPPQLRERADEAIRRGLERLEGHGLTAETSLRRGRAAAEILDEAASFDASLVVLGSRGGGGERPVRSWSGTVARRVARHARCSVFIAAAQEPAKPAGRPE